MHIAIINDSRDANASGRQLARVGTLKPEASVSFFGVSNFGDLEAAGNLVDALDAMDGMKGAVLVNVAPRHSGSSHWSNGTPFCHFTYKDTVVVSTLDGVTLSLMKKLNLLESIALMDIATVAEDMNSKGMLSESVAKYLPHTQFRSYDFAPRVAIALLEGYTPPSKSASMADIPDAPQAVWWIDNFGNVKTTMLPEELDFTPGEERETALGTFRCYEQLSHVPKGDAGLILGRSGIEDRRFLEIAIQGERANETLGIEIGDLLSK